MRLTGPGQNGAEKNMSLNIGPGKPACSFRDRLPRTALRPAAPKLLCAALLLGLLALLWTPPSGAQSKAEVLGPYYATPRGVVEQMLRLGELQPGELHYDLGSGDGRIVIMAARKFQARSVGFEIDPGLVARSRERIAALGLSERARIEARDLMTADFSKADLVTIYLLPVAMKKLEPLLKRELRPGARVVVHYFPFEGWKPEETVTVAGGPGGKGPLYPLYLYRR